MSELSRRALLALSLTTLGAWLVRPQAAGAGAGDPPEGWSYRDNDFASHRAMALAHAPILRLAIEVLRREPGPLLDLGAGNGALADAIAHHVPGCRPYGLERVPERAARAARVCPEHGGMVEVGDMFEDSPVWDRDYALVLVMPGRLVEARPEQAEGLRARLRARARNLLVYAYPDWLFLGGSLPTLCARAGLWTPATDPGCRVALAQVR